MQRLSRMRMHEDLEKMIEKTGISVSYDVIFQVHVPSSCFRREEQDIKAFLEWLEVENVSKRPFKYISVSYGIPDEKLAFFFEIDE